MIEFKNLLKTAASNPSDDAARVALAVAFRTVDEEALFEESWGFDALDFIAAQGLRKAATDEAARVLSQL